jgi:sulfur-oxidizing protein SoxX
MPLPGSGRSPMRRLVERWLRLCAVLCCVACLHAAPAPLLPYAVHADGIDDSLTGRPGDAERGRAIVENRQLSACLLCHAGPFPAPHLQGNIAPALNAVGARLSPAQIRLCLVDPRKVNPDTIMPAYYVIDGLNRVGAAWRDRPALSAEQIEDVVAFLAALRGP